MKVKVYTTSHCPHCKTVKRYLRENDIPFTEYNVERDPRKADEMYRKSRQHGVPVIDVKGKVLVGFSKAELESALKR